MSFFLLFTDFFISFFKITTNYPDKYALATQNGCKWNGYKSNINDITFFMCKLIFLYFYTICNCANLSG